MIAHEGPAGKLNLMTRQQMDTYLNHDEILTELKKMIKIELEKKYAEEFRKYTNQTQIDEIHNNYKKIFIKLPD